MIQSACQGFRQLLSRDEGTCAVCVSLPVFISTLFKFYFFRAVQVRNWIVEGEEEEEGEGEGEKEDQKWAVYARIFKHV